MKAKARVLSERNSGSLIRPATRMRRSMPIVRRNKAAASTSKPT